MKCLAALSLAILLFGCSDSGASNDGGGVGGDQDGGEGGVGGTGDVSCSAEGICVGNPGGNWMGPFALIKSSIGCEGAFPESVRTLFQGFQPGTASCECTCGAATAVCSTVIQATGYAMLDCSLAQGVHTLSERQCYNTFSASHSVRLWPASTSCGAGTVTATLPTPTFLRALDVCGSFTAEAGECDAGLTCVPKPGSSFEAGLCYVQEGDHACPTDFPNKTLSYSGFTDTRACAGSCACQASGASCSVSVNRYTGTNCSNPRDVVVVRSSEDSCVVTDSNDVKSIRPGDVEVVSNGTCTPAGINVAGTVTRDDATTVCCG